MKTAIVYYTLNGNCDFVAKELKSRLNADTIRLQASDQRQRGGAAKFLWALGMAFKRKNPLLKSYSFDPNAYDLIVIGTPIWASSPAPPIEAFISDTGLAGKKVALYICHMGKNEGAMDKFKTMFAGSSIIAAAEFKAAIKTPDDTKRQIEEWVKGFGTIT